MAENELKPKSFRINDETAERIKTITSEIGGNQQEALAKMIEAYEFQKGKAILVERKADIERFENHVSVLVRMFLGILEDNQNISETIRTEFAAQMNSKDLIIQELQEKCSTMATEYDVATTQLDKLQKINESINEQLNKALADLKEKETQYGSMLADKDSLNKALASALDDLKCQIASMTDENLAAKETEKKLEDIKNLYAAAEQEIASLRKHLEVVKDDSERNLVQALELKDIEFEKKMLSVEKTHQSTIQKLEQEKRAAIDNYQTRYLSLLDQIKEQELTLAGRKKKNKTKSITEGDK